MLTLNLEGQSKLCEILVKSTTEGGSESSILLLGALRGNAKCHLSQIDTGGRGESQVNTKLKVMYFVNSPLIKNVQLTFFTRHNTGSIKCVRYNPICKGYVMLIN